MTRGRGSLTPEERRYKKVIAKNLNDLLVATSKRKIDVHKATGIPVSTLTGYFQGKTLPNSNNVQAMADFFGILKSDIDPRFGPGYSINNDVDLDRIIKEGTATYKSKPLSAELSKAIRNLLDAAEE